MVRLIVRKRRNLGGVDDGFVDQQDRDVVANRVDAVALSTLQAFSRFLAMLHWLLAHGANQDVE
jgi:hypothetical protein